MAVATHTKPVRVAHLIHCLKLGGLEQLVLELASRGREQQIEPLLIALGDDGPLRAEFARRNIPVVWFGDLPGLSFQVLRRIRATLTANGIEVVHAHDLGPWLNAVATRALRPSTGVLATFHQLSPPTGTTLQVASLAARFSSALVACGDEVRAEIEGWAPSGARLVTIGNGVPLPALPTAQQRRDARAKLLLPEHATAIGYIGRLHEEKGPDLLVKAFLQHFRDDPAVHLVLIGTGTMQEQLRTLAAGAPNVHLAGELIGAAALLPAFDIYSQPSLREGRSLSMLEAMAAGLPTVAHALPAVSEIHLEGKTALLVRSGDLAALGDALKSLVADPQRREAMGAAARERSRLYSIDTMVEAYAALYRESAEGARA